MTSPDLSQLLSLALAATETATKVGSGKLEGGWSFVIASYALTYISLGLYGLSLWLRRTAQQKKDTP